MQSKTAKPNRNDGGYKDYMRFYKLYAYAEPFDYLLILLGTVGGLVAGSALPLAAYLFGSCLDDVAVLTDHHKQLQKMSETALHAVFVGLISAGGYFFQAACWMSVGERQAAKMGYLYLQALLRQDLSFFDQEISTGAVVEGLSADTFIIKQATGEKVGKFIQIIGTLLSGYIIAFTKGWKLTLFVSAMMPLIVASVYCMDLIVSKTSRKVLEANGDAAKIVEQVVNAIRTVVVPFGGEKKAIKAYDKAIGKSKDASFHESVASGLGMGVIMFVTFNMYASMLWFGAQLILSDGYTGGKVLTIIFSIVVGTGVLGQCSPSLTAMGAGCVAAQRMYRVINRVPIVDMADETGVVLDQAHFKGEIQLSNVTFSYPSRPGQQIFSGLNLLIKAGSITALVGGSGSGKSTIVSLIQRFYDPQEGDVLVDKVSLRLLRLGWFRRQVGIVPQEPVLLGGTVRENIAYGRDEGSLTTDEEIRVAASMANASKFIEQLPEGLDTLIGQGGFQLSGGQKQRIAIARAVLKDPRILLLDEATSALDAESESLVHEALHKIMCNRTTLVIAHRLTTLKAAHQITVLNQGVIVEQGTHDELIRKPGGLLSQLMDMEQSRYRSIQEEEELQIIRSGAGTPARLRGTPNISPFGSPHRQLSTISVDSFRSATSFSNTPSRGFRSAYATPGRASSRGCCSPVETPSRGYCSPLGTPSRFFGSPLRPKIDTTVDNVNNTFVEQSHGNIQLPTASNVQCNNMVQGEPGESQRMLLGEMFKLDKNSFEEDIDDLNDNEMICYELEDISSTPHTLSSPSSSNPNFLRLASYLKRREVPLLMIGSVAACLNGAVMPVVGYLFASIIHTFYKPPEQIRHSCLIWIHLFIVVACITLLLTPIQNMCFSICGEKLVHRIRLLTFNIVLHQPMQWFDSPNNASGILSSRLLRDASRLKMIVGDALSLIVQNMSTVVVGLFIAMSTCWELALLIVGLLPLYGLNGYIQIRMGEALDARAKIMYQETSQLAHDALGSIRTVASFCAEKKILSCYHGKSSVCVKSGYRRALIAGIGMAVSYVVMFGLLGLSFWAGGRLVFSGKVTFDGFVKTFLAVELSAVAVSLSLAVAPDIACAKPALASIFSILDLPYKNLDSGLQLDQLRGEIQFQNVCFAYPLRTEMQIFQDLSFTIQPGKTLAIVGESGGGKSTVLALMQKLYEVNAGYIKLDKIDINLLQTKWLRKQIGVVSQEPVLFNDTIRANIKYGMKTSDEEDDTEVVGDAMSEQMIIRAAEVANAHKFISGLPDGYESMVGERGVQLSGGQKQRIAIARALVRDPRILLLDEATSALDVGAEIVVQAALEKAAIGRSTIIVAHRLSTVRNAHCIIVLKDGCVAEQGSHDQLILNHPHGLYASLVNFSSTRHTHT